jgi:hypothetical protein
LIVAAIAAMPSPLLAQCGFEHPGQASKIQMALTQAFLFCSPDGTGSAGVLPNTSTEGGIPACSPPETFGELSGNYSSRWRFDPRIGTGGIQLKVSRAFPASPLNPPDNSADIAVLLKLHGVVGEDGPASGTGRLFILYRATLDDRAGGDTTMVDVPLYTDVPVTSGRAVLKTSFDSMLNDAPLNQPGLPTCSSVELIYMAVDDPNGDTFAVPGAYLP